jgi:hypothetical protein
LLRRGGCRHACFARECPQGGAGSRAGKKTASI